MQSDRIIIYTSDIEKLTGKSYWAAWRELKLLKDCLGKQKHQSVTIKEYCEYKGLNVQEACSKLGVRIS